MRKWILAFQLFFSLFIPFGVRAQTLFSIDSLQVQIWPEYDKPGVLVIYQATLPAGTILPTTISMRIPSVAGEPNAVAVRQMDGSLYTVEHTRQVSGEWAAIRFTTTTLEFQLEYYDPSLQMDGDARHFQYVWPGDYAISQFIIQVQQPAGVSDIRLSPSLGSGTTGGDNLVYFTQDVGAIAAGQDIRITLDYNKATDTLSAESLPVQPSAPIPQSTVPDLNVSAWLPWLLGILGAGLIIGGIIWFWQSGKQPTARHKQRRRSRTTAGEPAHAVNPAEEAIYCSQCGKRASSGDLFCRSCGTQIRNK